MPDPKSPWFRPGRVDTGALPLTEPHPAPIFDTGPHPEPLHSSVDVLELDDPIFDVDEPALLKPTPEPVGVSAQPKAVPGQYQHVKWWKFILLTFGVWTIAAAIGAGMYYWWFHSMDKTWPDFAVLMYVLVCIVAALLVSMVESRPMLAATSVALMSAPFASGAAAAGLYGMYVFGWITP